MAEDRAGVFLATCGGGSIYWSAGRRTGRRAQQVDLELITLGKISGEFYVNGILITILQRPEYFLHRLNKIRIGQKLFKCKLPNLSGFHA